MHYSIVSTYPPDRCGLAGFTASLLNALAAKTPDVGRVIRVVDQPERSAPPEVAADLVAGDPASLRRAAGLINLSDVAIVQYEHGVYGGRDGAEILALLDAITVPRVLVLHTVPTAPTWRRRWVFQATLARAEAVVVMTAAARDRLVALYDVNERRLQVIPHGAHDVGAILTGAARPACPTVLTWGLLGPGKGIEWGIDAMAELAGLDPAPRYVVAGPTRSSVLRRDGEAYRHQLTTQITRRGLDGVVRLDGRYRDAASLGRLIRTADVVLLPYDSRDQTSSAVLTAAVAALLPVVATRFPHAVEMLGGGAGELVAHQDPAGMAAALRMILTRQDVAASMRRAAAQAAPRLHWAAVATSYRELAGELLPSAVR